MSVAPEDARLTGGGTPEQSPWTIAEVYHPRILDNVKSYLTRGDKEPTLLGIQSAAFRYFKKAVHVMMHSEKASGKTTAMVIRIITITLIVITCMDNHPAEESAQRSTSRVPFALILAPTEELCNKLKEMVQYLTVGLTAHLIKVLSVCKPTGPLMLLDGGTDIIIGTPEMVEYLDGHGCIDWTYLSFLGLDRVDDLMAPDHKEHIEKLLHPESGTISRGTQVGYTLISTSSKMTPELRSHILQNYTGAQHGYETCELSVESLEVIKTTMY